jgi:hypothetical protein
MFAAISGRSLKMIARYLAEKGAKLSVSGYAFSRVGADTNVYNRP